MSENNENQNRLDETTVEPTAEPTAEPTVEPTAEPSTNEKIDDDDNGGADDNSSAAPENYDFTNLKLPDGFKIDEKLLEKFTPVGKKLNLSQEQANELANLLVTFQQEQLADAPNKIAEYKKQEKAATKLSYEKLLNEDEEIGKGDKTKMNAYLDVADIGYKNFATDELKGVLQELSLDYHPAVIKLFHKLGELCGNDKILNANKPTGIKLDPAEILYKDTSANNND